MGVDRVDVAAAGLEVTVKSSNMSNESNESTAAPLVAGGAAAAFELTEAAEELAAGADNMSNSLHRSFEDEASGVELLGMLEVEVLIVLLADEVDLDGTSDGEEMRAGPVVVGTASPPPVP